VNYLGPFYFTQLLLENIKACKEGRIVNVASVAHKHWPGELDCDDLNMDKGNYIGFKAYCRSKLCNVLATRQ